jgi:hypothetical protein
MCNYCHAIKSETVGDTYNLSDKERKLLNCSCSHQMYIIPEHNYRVIENQGLI